MKKLIDAEELKELLRKERCCCPEEFYEIGYNAGIDDAVKAVDNMQAADAWPALRAEWKFVTEDEWGKVFACSNCRNVVTCETFENPLDAERFFCPECGARMDAQEGGNRDG